MSSGGADRGTRRASSIARLPSVPRKWVEMAVEPTQVKVQAAAANTHDRNAQEVLVRLATYNPMGGVPRLPERSEGAALRRRVSFDHVKDLPHLKKVPTSTARQTSFLHSPPSHPMKTRFGHVHSLLHSQHFCLKELPLSDRLQTTLSPPAVLAQHSVKIPGHSDQSLFLVAMRRGSAKNDKIENFPPGKKTRKNDDSSSSKSAFSPEFVSRQVPAGQPRDVPFFPPTDADWHYAN